MPPGPVRCAAPESMSYHVLADIPLRRRTACLFTVRKEGKGRGGSVFHLPRLAIPSLPPSLPPVLRPSRFLAEPFACRVYSSHRLTLPPKRKKRLSTPFSPNYSISMTPWGWWGDVKKRGTGSSSCLPRVYFSARG